MKFYQRLLQETENERLGLLSAPIIERCLKGSITIDDYVSFLCQAFNHVKHTVPLLMATGARLADDKEWLRVSIAEYIEEEIGHQEWILNDIQSCGFDKEAVRILPPSPSTELMVAYAYDMIQRVNPVGFFGMVHVLEGTSINMADKVADSIANALNLPRSAFSYLYSHGSLDIEHVAFFEDLMNKIDDEQDQNAIIHACKMFYQLYGDIFRNLNAEHNVPRVLKEA